MNIIDKFEKLIGIFSIKVFNKGILVDEYCDNNLIVVGYKTSLQRLLSGLNFDGRITTIGFGTSGAAPAVTDTALSNAFTKNLSGYVLPDASSITFNWSLGSTEANGLNIQEYGLITAGGILFARKTYSAILKSSDITIDGSWTIQV